MADDGERCSMYNFIVCVIIIGLICVLGLIGNLTSLFVLLKHKTETVTIFLLQSICLSDSLLLLTSVVVYCLPAGFEYARSRGYTTDGDADAYVITVWPFALIAHTLTIWLTLLVTFTRYGAVCKPQQNFKAQNLRSTRFQVLAVVVLAVLYNIPRFFEHKPIRSITLENQTDNSSVVVVNLGDEALYQIIYSNVIYFAVMYIIPLTCLGYMNIRLIRALKQLRQKRKQMTGREQPPNDQITLCIVITVSVFVVCQTPALVNQIFWAALSKDDRTCGYFHFYYTRLSDVLVVVNSACNIIIYCLCGKGFRDIFYEAICQRCLPKRTPQNEQVEATVDAKSSLLRNKGADQGEPANV